MSGINQIIFINYEKITICFYLCIWNAEFTTPDKAGSNKEITMEEDNVTYVVEYKEIACDYYRRVCTYRNGELESCTEWECGYRLDEIVVEG